MRNKEDIIFRLTNILRKRLRRAIKAGYKTGSAIKDLGCSIEELKKHLELKFQEGMTWDNYGEWQIDHIVPISSVDLTNSEEVAKICHYSNLQPLWALDNKKKSDNIS